MERVHAPEEERAEVPFATMKELRTRADADRTTIAKIVLANEMSIMGRSEAEVNAFVDKIINAMVATVKSGLGMPEDDVCPPRSGCIARQRPSTSAS